MEEKYLQYTIMNLCEEAVAMMDCDKRDEALETLKTANMILKFERWNRPSPYFTPMHKELVKMVDDTAVKVVRAIIGE